MLTRMPMATMKRPKTTVCMRTFMSHAVTYAVCALVRSCGCSLECLWLHGRDQTQLCVFMYIRVYIYIYICMYVYICIYTLTHTHMCIYTYTHTHTHTHTRMSYADTYVVCVRSRSCGCSVKCYIRVA